MYTHVGCTILIYDSVRFLNGICSLSSTLYFGVGRKAIDVTGSLALFFQKYLHTQHTSDEEGVKHIYAWRGSSDEKLDLFHVYTQSLVFEAIAKI